jgi:hypothetical protein
MEFERFFASTIDYNQFLWEDVIGDGSCCFRSFANILNYYNNNNLKIILNKEDYSKINNIKDKNNNDYDYDEWGYDGNEQELIAKLLQEKSTKYIFKNWDFKINQLGCETIGEIVKITHNLKENNKEYYKKLYSTFSGDDIDDEMTDRWGSLAEIIALSNELKVPVNIYTPVRYFKKNKEIKPVKLTRRCTFPINTRMKIYVKYGDEYSDKKTINLLYQESENGNQHYIPLYPKDNIEN